MEGIMKEFKGTKGEWTINHWEHGEGGVIYCSKSNGVAYCGELNGVTRFKGDAICDEQYHIVSDLRPNDHNVEHSFEGARIADISAFSEESTANARLISASPELLDALQVCWASLKTYGDHPIVDKQCKLAINKALGL